MICKNKKTTIIYVLKMLNKCSDETHPISQITMAKTLTLMGISCDRKTISRDINCLIQCGYDIVKVTGKGFFLKKNVLSQEDIKLLVKGLDCLDIQETQKIDIHTKLNSLLNN